MSAGRRPGWRWPYSSSSRHCRSRRACTFCFASTAALVPALSRPALRTVLGSESAHPKVIGSSSVSCRSAVLRLLTRRRRPGSRHRLRRLLTSGCEHKQARDTARKGGRSRAQEQETVKSLSRSDWEKSSPNTIGVPVPHELPTQDDSIEKWE